MLAQRKPGKRKITNLIMMRAISKCKYDKSSSCARARSGSPPGHIDCTHFHAFTSVFLGRELEGGSELPSPPPSSRSRASNKTSATAYLRPPNQIVPRPPRQPHIPLFPIHTPLPRLHFILVALHLGECLCTKRLPRRPALLTACRLWSARAICALSARLGFFFFFFSSPEQQVGSRPLLPPLPPPSLLLSWRRPEDLLQQPLAGAVPRNTFLACFFSGLKG